MTIDLQTLGWNNFFEAYFAPYKEQDLLPGRVGIQHKDRYVVYTEVGEVWANVRGKLRFEAAGIHDFPAVGDWVALQLRNDNTAATIHAVLERRSKFSRKLPGKEDEEQILAANIDIVFLVMGLDANYNLRRLERYLTVAWESGARPVIVLNKIDKCNDAQEKKSEVEQIAHGTDIFLISAKHNIGIEPLRTMLTAGTTGVLLGPSGVGKSTITNLLVGKDYAQTQEVREWDDRGRHTTARRELVILPGGGLIIDTPGLRELQLWEGETGLEEVFEDIEELAAQCRFRDCKHISEPDCAVKRALEEGTLQLERYESYKKLQREISYQKRKYDSNAQRVENQKWKKISKEIKQIQKGSKRR